MRKLLSGLMATALAASLAVASVVPVNAAPVIAPSAPAASNDVQKVQDWRWRRLGNGHYSEGGNWRNIPGGRDIENRIYRQGVRDGWRRDGWRRDEWRRADNHRYWRGHRGYRNWRRGYRERNGWWFPLAAFTAGAVIGNVINEPRVIYRRSGGSAHVDWCYDRYRSYRASDNTYQPYNGGRRQCYSPYS